MINRKFFDIIKSFIELKNFKISLVKALLFALLINISFIGESRAQALDISLKCGYFYNDTTIDPLAEGQCSDITSVAGSVFKICKENGAYVGKMGVFSSKLDAGGCFDVGPCNVCLSANAAVKTGDSAASSSTDNALVSGICNAYQIVTGKAGKVFAAFAVIATGVGFFTGKVQWGLIISLVLGIAAIFGAPSIVSAITGDSQPICSASIIKP